MELQLVATDVNGVIWHAIRLDDGMWTPPGNVNSVVGNIGSFADAHIAGNVDGMHLIGHTVGAFGGGQTL
jgi:hypothetical protein